MVQALALTRGSCALQLARMVAIIGRIRRTVARAVPVTPAYAEARLALNALIPSPLPWPLQQAADAVAPQAGLRLLKEAARTLAGGGRTAAEPAVPVAGPRAA